MRVSLLVCCLPALFQPAWTGPSNAGELEIWLFGPGGNSADIGRDVLWLESPDFGGVVGSSEVIGTYDLWIEIANDFLLEIDATIRKVTWWGSYWNDFEEPTGAGFNLRFYMMDVGCLPEDVPFLEYLLPGDDCCEALADGGDQYSQFVYEFCLSLPLVAGQYWFSAQMADHEFPPQWGRLSAAHEQLCDSAFRSPYFSYPDWVETPGMIIYDASQMFEDMCEATATRNTNWGAIRGLYR